MRVVRIWTLILASTVAYCGCSRYGSRNDERQPAHSQPFAQRQTPKQIEPPPESKKIDETVEQDEPLIKQSFLNPDSPSAKASKFGGLSTAAATQQVLANIVDATEFGSILVVWMFDKTDSAVEIASPTIGELEDFYGRLQKDEKRSQVKSAVMAFGGDVQFLLEEPSDDTSAVIAAIGQFRRSDSTGTEMTFTALKQARDRYLSFRTEQRFHTMFVVVTDEAGDDAHVIDDIIPDFRQHSLAVYVIGVPAPFGRTAAAKGKEASIRQGPESCYPERLKLAFWGDPFGLDLMDSGFGPFHLERICRAGGGAYLAIRPESGGGFYNPLDTRWPNPHALRFDANVMRKYAPSYVSEKDYRALLSENAACAALHEAAKLSMDETLDYPAVEFVVRSQAQLARDLRTAQMKAARLAPQIEEFYEVLKRGEDDRDKLTQPRWQAGFDLAMGRVSAAKARIDGYNTMLGLLKGGKQFENEGSKTWYLESADVTEDAGSGIRKLGTQARMYLKRVVDEHPNTPWAIIADRELKNPVGWKWVEK